MELTFINKAREVFTPASPAIGENHTRREEAYKLENYLSEPGSQILIHGKSGVGKTSLILKVLKGNHNYLRYQCKRSTTYEDIISYFKEKLCEPIPEQTEVISSDTSQFNIGFAKLGGFKINTGSSRKEVFKSRNWYNSSDLISDIAPECWKLILDDFEKIESPEVINKIAELLKEFSDQAPYIKFADGSVGVTKMIIVGVAENITDLWRGDKSIFGRIMSIHLEAFQDFQIKQFFDNGFRLLSLEPEKGVVESFVILAAGYPRYAHSFGLEACTEFDRRCKAEYITIPTTIDKEIAKSARDSTILRYEPTYNEAFQFAVRSRSYSQQLHYKVLKAVANIRKEVCTLEEIVQVTNSIDHTISVKSIRRVLGELANKNRGSILFRPSNIRGSYAFKDGLLKSFIRMKFHVLAQSSDID